MSEFFVPKVDDAIVRVDSHRISVFPHRGNPWFLSLSTTTTDGQDSGWILRRSADENSAVKLFEGSSQEAEEAFESLKRQLSGGGGDSNRKASSDTRQGPKQTAAALQENPSLQSLPKVRHPVLTMGQMALLIGGAAIGALFTAALYGDTQPRRYAQPEAVSLEAPAEIDSGDLKEQGPAVDLPKAEEASDQVADEAPEAQHEERSAMLDIAGFPGQMPLGLPQGVENPWVNMPMPPAGPFDGACEPGDDNCAHPPGAVSGASNEAPGGIELDIASLPPVYEMPSFDDSEIEAEEAQQLEDHLGALEEEHEAPSDLSEELFTSNLDRLPDAQERVSGEIEAATDPVAGAAIPQRAETEPLEQEAQELAVELSDGPEVAQEAVEAAPGGDAAHGQAMDPELTERFMRSIERAILDSDEPEALIARLGRINGVLARGEMVTPEMLEGMPDYLVREFEVGGALDDSAEAVAAPVRLDRSVLPRNSRGIPTVTEENMWIYYPDGIMLPMPGGGTLEDVKDIQSFGLDP